MSVYFSSFGGSVLKTMNNWDIISKEHPMKFDFNYKVKISDLWQASMYYTYSSYLAVINVCCIVSSIVLLIKLWGTAPGWLKAFLILFLLLFTVIQPLMVYVKSKNSLDGNLSEISLEFFDTEIIIKADGKTQTKYYRNIKGIVKKPTIIVIYMEDGNGYILNNRVTGSDKKAFFNFVKDKITQNNEKR